MKTLETLALMGLAMVFLSPVQASAERKKPAEPVPNFSSLWSPDQQVQYYRNRGEFSPVRVVPHGDRAYPLPVALHQISPRWTWKGQTMDVDSYMKAQRASGVIVLKDGKVLLERYGLGRTHQDVWESQSAGKSVTAILVGAAIQDGYIKSADDLVTDYIPQLKGGAYDGVTIRHLLTMTSGVKFDMDYVSPEGNGSQIFVWPFAKEDPAVYMSRLSRAHPPGAKFVYTDGDAFLAGLLVSRATGKFLSAYLAEKLWKPFGMEHEAHWILTPAGHELGDGSISMALRDYARIGQFMLEGGKANGVQVLPPDWFADATRTQVATPPAHRSGAAGYGYFWWIYKDSYAARGQAGQAIHVYPKDKVVIAVNSAWPEPGTEEDRRALNEFIEALHAAAVAHR